MALVLFNVTMKRVIIICQKHESLDPAYNVEMLLTDLKP
jgi:hypothetical protein